MHDLIIDIDIVLFFKHWFGSLDILIKKDKLKLKFLNPKNKSSQLSTHVNMNPETFYFTYSFTFFYSGKLYEKCVFQICVN